jgi:hypothetical protein
MSKRTASARNVSGAELETDMFVACGRTEEICLVRSKGCLSVRTGVVVVRRIYP